MKQIKQGKEKKEEKRSRFFSAGTVVFVLIIALGAGTRLIKDVREKERRAQEHQMSEAETDSQELILETETQKPSPSETETEPETEEETIAYDSPIDFEALWEINEDVVAWIRIPDTRIDYPVLQGRDNEQYLHTDIEGNDSVAGAIYLDMDDAPDFSSLHNILYGHHMKNGTMFKDVVFYKEQDFFDEHQDIYIYTPKKEIHLKALAALYTSADGIRRRTRFYSGRALDDYVRKMTSGAMTRAASTGPVHRLYSLITCSYEFPNARTILYAYEVEE